ncbi:GNAT family N-acetyltransferase [Magnetovirga frankeli]|nr:GNAT family N-acetyltransferase [gamma proteobacterium SS-5]
MIGLFHRVFAETPPAGWWQWKYSPEGLGGRAMGLWDEDGNLLAHNGGIPRTLLWRDREVSAIQIGDLMVAPQARGLFTRHGAFFQVSRFFFKHWVGADKPYAVCFGFTHERAMRLGVTLGLYQQVGTLDRLVLPARSGQRSWVWKIRQIRPSTADFDTLANRAWQAMRGQNRKGILGVRDARHIRSRYAARPAVDYSYFQISRRWPGPSAIAVVRNEGDSLKWLDFVGPLDLLRTTQNAMQRLAYAAGLAQVEFVASPEALAGLCSAGLLHREKVSATALITASACPDESLAGSAWWMAGDTDFL